MKNDTKIRSMAKTLSWRAVATSATALLVALFTGDLKIAFVIGGLEVGLKMLLYFFHERAWNRILWGKELAHQKVFAVFGDRMEPGLDAAEHIKDVLGRLQRPSVILDYYSHNFNELDTTKNWLNSLRDYSVFPIFIFKELNFAVIGFLSELGIDTVLIDNSDDKSLDLTPPFDTIKYTGRESESTKQIKQRLQF